MLKIVGYQYSFLDCIEKVCIFGVPSQDGEHISESVFVGPFTEMWKFQRQKDYGCACRSCVVYAILPRSLGGYSISSRVWSIISSLSLSRSSTTSVRIDESGSTLLLSFTTCGVQVICGYGNDK